MAKQVIGIDKIVAKSLGDRIEKALTLADEFGATDGGHHKMWVIDQMVRALLGDDYLYRLWVEKHKEGEDGPNTYDWDEGIEP